MIDGKRKAEILIEEKSGQRMRGVSEYSIKPLGTLVEIVLFPLFNSKLVIFNLSKMLF